MGRFHAVDTTSDADDIVSKFGGDKGDLRFRITYAGELKAAGKKPRAEEKDAIRRYVSSQLAELWQLHPVFRGYGLVYQMPRESPIVNYGGGDFSSFGTNHHYYRERSVRIDDYQPHIMSGLNEPLDVSGRKYIPLVRSNFALTCGLDILFLRKQGAGALIAEGGDLDNRIKTLFDGLRVPKPDEISQPPSQQEAEELTFCLLEDDALITDFSVRADRLLTHPGATESEVLLVIDVVVRVSHLTSNNLGFLSE